MQSLRHTILSTLRNSVHALTLMLSISSCRTSKMVPAVADHVTRDSVYQQSVQFDSTYVEHDHFMEYHPASHIGHHFSDIAHPSSRINNHASRIANHASLIEVDTLFVRDRSTEYRYRFLRDTVRIVRFDTVPVIVQTPATPARSPFRIPPWIYLLAALFLVLTALRFGRKR